MRAEDWEREHLELEGSPVTLVTYRLCGSFVAEVESVSSGVVIARSVGKVGQAVRNQAIETAAERLLRTRRIDPSLTVGG